MFQTRRVLEGLNSIYKKDTRVKLVVVSRTARGWYTAYCAGQPAVHCELLSAADKERALLTMPSKMCLASTLKKTLLSPPALVLGAAQSKTATPTSLTYLWFELVYSTSVLEQRSCKINENSTFIQMSLSWARTSKTSIIFLPLIKFSLHHSCNRRKQFYVLNVYRSLQINFLNNDLCV